MIAQRLGLQGILSEKTGMLEEYLNHTQEQQLVGSVKSWLSHSSHRDWLLILDNVDDLQSYDITRYLPVTNGHRYDRKDKYRQSHSIWA
jgi:hypothetical protein